MATDNYKIDETAASSDDDPTIELEALTEPLLAADLEVEAEPGAHAYAQEDDTGTFESPQETIAASRSELRGKNEVIEKLQYDIELLRARWTGLEKEIGIREALTDDINAELRDIRDQLARSKRKLARRDNKIASLQQDLSARSTELEKLAADLSDKVSQSEQIRKLEKSSNESIASLQQQLEDAIRDIARKDGEIEQHSETIAGLSDRASRLEQRNSDLSEKIENYEQESKRHRRQLKSFQKQSREETDMALQRDRQMMVEQEGQLASSRQEIHDLRSQIVRTEQYADTIRSKLKDAASHADEALETRQLLESSLDRALSQVNDLTGKLGQERLAVSELSAENAQLNEKLEFESRDTQSELAAARKSATKLEALNEKLTSELIDHRDFKQALETQLENTEKKIGRDMRAMANETRMLKERNEELETSVASKDKSIAVLLNELAGRSPGAKAAKESANEGRDVDAQIPELADADKAVDRTVRLLVGNVDGRKLRFPLFKDRLTLGRAPQNDIQLNSQHISRRHAIIKTENGKTMIVDQGSKNGICVNETRVTEQELRNGDIVTIGAADFCYEERAKR